MPKNSGNANQQAKVKNTVQEWSKYANIKFQNVAYDSTKPADLRITFDPSSGSWCYVAEELKNVPANQPTTNLGWIDPSSITTSDDIGVILHEFGHALGFLHEHQSPARGGTLTLNRNGRSSARRHSSSDHWTRSCYKLLYVYSRLDSGPSSEANIGCLQSQ